MNPEQVKIAQELTSCKEFLWTPGMMRLRLTDINKNDYLRKEGRVPGGYDDWPYDEWLVVPDLMDSPTGGALLDMLPPGFSIFDGSTIDGNRDFRIKLLGVHHRTFCGSTLAEAAASVLLSLWRNS